MRAWARLERTPLPAWAARLRYAEQFGVEPHLVNPPLDWWLRWGVWQDAQASRQAHENARSNSDWAGSMTADDREAMLWAERDPDEQN